MKVPAPYTLTQAERERVARIEQLEASGAAGVAPLVAMLDDASWVVRRAVVSALASLGAPALAPLCAVLRSQRDSEARIAAAVDALVASHAAVEDGMLSLAQAPDPAIVADAAQVLGRRRSQAGIPVLVQLTQHDNDNVAVAAIEALGRVGGRAAVEALIRAVGSGNFFRTFPAIDVLGRSGDPRVVEPLARLLTNPSYLPEAARALGRSGEPTAVKPLAELLTPSAPDAVVRVVALALCELRERFEEKTGGRAKLIEELLHDQITPEAARRLLRSLASADVSEAVALCKLLGDLGNEEAASALVSKLDGPLPLATAAAEALKKLGKAADGWLGEALRHGSSERRRALLPVVAHSGAARQVAACLDDPDPEVKALACDTLARIGDPSAVRALFRLLHDGNLRVVHAATAAIQALGTREAHELALEATRSESPAVRRAAVRIVGYFGDTAGLPAMIGALQDPDLRVREAALQSLPYLEDVRALEALIDATKKPEAKMRGLAMRALGHLPKANERVYSLLLKGLSDDDAWVRYYACQALGRLNYGPAATRIAARLADEAGQVRVAAVEALSHLDSPEAHEALRKAATSADTDIQRAALVGLGIAHRPEDLPVILAAATGQDIATRLMALSALISFSSPDVLSALQAAVADADEQVHTAAIDMLAARPEPEATRILVQQLASEESRERAKAALTVSSEGRVTGLLTELESASDELAPLVLAVLARMEPSAARPALLAAMRSHNVAARKAAAPVLAAQAAPEMTEALREAADHDPDAEVRRICSLLLSH